MDAQTRKTTTALGDTVLSLTAADLSYDGEGRLGLELELQVNQHRAC